MLFRDEIAGERRWPRRRYMIATGLIIAALAALAILAAYDRRLAAMFVVSAAVIFLALRLVAVLTMALARRLPRQRSTLMRLAVTNIYRPGALTPSVVLSLGLGLSLLVTLVEIDGNLHRQFAAALPEKAPSFFFIDIPSADADRFDAFVRAQTPGATLERVPMLRGRIIAAGGNESRGTQARRRIGLGAARRPRYHLCAVAAGRLAPGRRRMVARRLFRSAAGFA